MPVVKGAFVVKRDSLEMRWRVPLGAWPGPLLAPHVPINLDQSAWPWWEEELRSSSQHHWLWAVTQLALLRGRDWGVLGCVGVPLQAGRKKKQLWLFVLLFYFIIPLLFITHRKKVSELKMISGKARLHPLSNRIQPVVSSITLGTVGGNESRVVWHV